MTKQRRKTKRAKKKKYSIEEINFFRKIKQIKDIYLDNALLGYRTDEPHKKNCGEMFLRWVKKEKKDTVISIVNVYELRPLFIGKIKKNQPDLSKKILKTLTDFSPNVVNKGGTLKLAKKYKNFWLFLIKKLNVSEEDAAHFTIAVALGVDLFVSFNKKAFKNKKRKIQNELISYRLKMPQIWNLKDIEENISRFNKIFN